MFQILDPEGNVLDKKLMPKLTDDDIRKMYGYMVLARKWDEIAWNLQREGRLLTFAPLTGQEASQVGSAYAMEKDDWLFPMYRSNAAMILRGMPMDLLFQYWSGDERGLKIPDDVNMFTIAIPVGTQIPHAAGFAWGMKIQKKKVGVVVYFGDAATSKGDFHEGLNFAGVFKAPLVAICENNQYAISVPRSRQTASETIAQKAAAYGFEGVQVDGNDVFAVYKVTKDALDKARNGNGPTLIECFTYRLGAHTTSDDPTKYRPVEEVEYWKKRDPIDRLRKFMVKKGIWSDSDEQKLLANVEVRVNDAVKKAEAVEAPKPEDMFNYVYEKATEQLRQQMSELK
ncbi:MAG: pyruvate dehydrogenase (acetyl-transferring) E1 component subunit alpha [Candidatus Aenigmarchaeota archaeon]|nr:pyruvate dehydrogenase (acetyl-transferring) E1 component subunit alpha [Candidatus Aenigmarchaeota archaeon]